MKIDRARLGELLDRLWADPEPGLEWDGQPDAVFENEDGVVVETWHTPQGTVRSAYALGHEDELMVEVTR